MKIYVVDSDEGTRSMLLYVLGEQSYTASGFETADSFKAALRAELRDAERLIARRAERKGRARVGEKEIVVEHPADALGKLIQFRRNLRGERHEQRRRGQNGGAQRHDAPRPNAGRAAAEQQRKNQRQQRRGADLRAEKRDDEQQRDFKQRQREKRLLASGERRADARKDEREQQ